MWRVVVVLLIAGCAAKPPPIPPRPKVPTTCFTIPDPQLTCQKQCLPIEPEIKRCLRLAERDHYHPTGKVIIRFSGDAEGRVENLRYEMRGGDLESVAGCIHAAFRRFTPCSPLEAGVELALPFVFARGG